MSEHRFSIALGVLTLLFLRAYAIEEGGVINIDLSSLNSTHSLVKVREILHGATKIHLENAYDIGYFIIQVHSFATPIYLSRGNDTDEVGVNGTNVGLVQMRTATEFDFYVDGVDHTHVLIVVVGYEIKDPIPGACNLTFETEDAPYLKISYTDALIRLDAQPPRLGDIPCGMVNISIDVYHMYMEEQDFSAESYFESIEKMLTPEDTVRNGRKVRSPSGLPPMRKYFAAYQGVGTVYGIVANYYGFRSAYVPAASYGCDLKNNSCIGPLTTSWKVICGFMVFYGLFLCYMGHRFFQLNLFCIGFVVASVLTYIIVSYTNLTEWEALVTLAIVGIVYGGLCLVIWWKFKIPILSVTLTYFVAGFLISGIFFYSGPGDSNLFRNDTNFWSVLIGISLLVTIILLIISHWPSNIIATSFVGAYMTIIPFDVYFGGTLRYALLNIIHRATIANFRMAIIDPPYQATEITLIISMVLIALLGMYVQWRYVRGRAPFPPSNILDRGSVFNRLYFYGEPNPPRASENTPLLSEANPDPNTRYYHRM